jgi:TolB protein
LRWSFLSPAILALVTNVATAQCPPNGTAGLWIVFGSFRNGDFASSAHAIRPDGTMECRISRHPDGRPGVLDPQIAPDGSSIVFTRGGGGSHRTAVWIMAQDGSDERRLTDEVMVRFDNGRAGPTLSPRGDVVAFVAQFGDTRMIQLLSMAGGGIRTLGPGEFPAWSPDGTRLAFTLGARDSARVWVVEVTTGERRALTTGAGSRHPAWSPDGARIAFSRLNGETSDLFVMAADGSDIAALTSTASLPEVHPAWSPDGRLIAFSAQPADAPDDWQHSIFVVPSVGGESRQVTSSRFHDTRPSWLTIED